jgi:hypothetical protein
MILRILAVAADKQAPASPWPFLAVALFVIGAIGIGWIVLWVRSDRKRVKRVRQTELPPWGEGSEGVSVTTTLLGPHPATVATEAIEGLGGYDIIVVDRDGVIGWVGPRFRTYRVELQARHAAFELGVRMQSTSAEQVTFICCVRPRYSRSVVDNSYCRDLAQALADETVRIANRRA